MGCQLWPRSPLVKARFKLFYLLVLMIFEEQSMNTQSVIWFWPSASDAPKNIYHRLRLEPLLRLLLPSVGEGRSFESPHTSIWSSTAQLLPEHRSISLFQNQGFEASHNKMRSLLVKTAPAGKGSFDPNILSGVGVVLVIPDEDLHKWTLKQNA